MAQPNFQPHSLPAIPPDIPTQTRAIVEQMIIAQQNNQWQQGLQLCEQALLQSPNSIFLLDYYALFQSHFENYPKVIEALKKILAIEPNNFKARFFLANAHRSLNYFQLALEEWEALTGHPNYPKEKLSELLCLIALCYHIIGDYPKSIEAVKIARRLYQDYGGDLGGLEKRETYCYLHAGDYKKGFESYEYRHKIHEDKHFVLMPHYKPEIMLTDREKDLTGKTILVVSEQGLGDMILFGRFLPLYRDKLKAIGGKIIFACYAELYQIFKSSPQMEGIEIMVASEKAPEHFDYWVKLMSLPYHLKTDQANLPKQLPYLIAPPKGEVTFSQVDKKYKIGLVWRSGAKGVDKTKRSMELKELKPIIENPTNQAHCVFISLQFDEDKEKIKNEIANENLSHLLYDSSPLMKTMAETAILINELDLVITVDTSIAHLAGALAKPVWVILPQESSWKWHRDHKTIWYPEVMTLFRQNLSIDWQIVTANIAACLAKVITTDGDFIHAEKHFPKPIVPENLSLPDSAEQLLEQCKKHFNNKDYFIAATYIKRMLAIKKVPKEDEKMMLSNLRAAVGTNEIDYSEAIAINKKLLACHNLTDIEKANAHLKQSFYLQQLWQPELAKKQVTLAMDAIKKSQQRHEPIPKDVMTYWHRQDMFAHMRTKLDATAWEKYEQRHQVVSYQALEYLPHHQPDKKWQKGEPIAGKNILVMMEQGYGDIIQFSRFLPLLARQAKQVIVEAYPALYPLFKNCLERDNIIVMERGQTPPPFDVWFLICSLPHLLSIKDFNQDRNPYLLFSESLKQKIPHIPGRQGVKKIAINWASSQIAKDKGKRDITLKELVIPLLKKGNIQLFAMQLTGTKEIHELGMQGLMVDLSPVIKTFFDTAIWMKAMDLVITVDSAPAHLAGALGVETALLLTQQAEWRWGKGDGGRVEKSLWYGDHFKIYRQEREGSWRSVMAEVLKAV